MSSGQRDGTGLHLQVLSDTRFIVQCTSYTGLEFSRGEKGTIALEAKFKWVSKDFVIKIIDYSWKSKLMPTFTMSKMSHFTIKTSCVFDESVLLCQGHSHFQLAGSSKCSLAHALLAPVGAFIWIENGVQMNWVMRGFICRGVCVCVCVCLFNIF